jgi:hypothetical protein
MFFLSLGLLEPFNNANATQENKPDGIKSLYLYLNGYNASYYYNWKITDYLILAVMYIAALLISCAAAYLCFSCTWKGSVTNVYIRILNAFIAFMLGPIYIIWYFLVNYLGGLC